MHAIPLRPHVCVLSNRVVCVCEGCCARCTRRMLPDRIRALDVVTVPAAAPFGVESVLLVHAYLIHGLRLVVSGVVVPLLPPDKPSCCESMAGRPDSALPSFPLVHNKSRTGAPLPHYPQYISPSTRPQSRDSTSAPPSPSHQKHTLIAPRSSSTPHAHLANAAQALSTTLSDLPGQPVASPPCYASTCEERDRRRRLRQGSGSGSGRGRELVGCHGRKASVCAQLFRGGKAVLCARRFEER
ncbi:hypothetical protein K458DRAFT_156911 [Lentithecium fluviatile CBS 122367]|uniref:Uncharacterized protein n=1 Tax=Lentithecium fluviatile CBS 122367 TaxID=1168545 RepID=A0A6G1IIN0_9PLEO|nr:hypothetical protein K458DRAFT_156911 [Lentithecium fluviatile CBS 122367]